MKLDTLKSDLILLLVAFIWGVAFVAQRTGMEHVGPFTFNGLRFFLASIALFPFLLFSKENSNNNCIQKKQKDKAGLIKFGIISSFFLFAGISFQQVGLVYTTAGKAGFITGLYVVIVPIFGFILKLHKTGINTWAGAILATIGMYFLSVTNQFTISFGDFLILMCSFCFAGHVLVIASFAKQYKAIQLSFIQSIICSIVSLIIAFAVEDVNMGGIINAAVPIFYGGVFSSAIAYSLQIYGQKKSHPAHASIIMSLESVFAALAGWIILNEVLTGRGLFGCTLILIGMLTSQLFRFNNKGKLNNF
ncbi:MAG: DMT family transporter [Desulfobacteraceae bacterium]|nr:DMT family transporter [Desulfobacteraceae bacterium]